MIPLFESIRAACPDTTGSDNRITVVVDSQPIGKSFALIDGAVKKHSTVAISCAIAMQFCVRSLDELASLLKLVSESPNAALTNCGWRPAGVGVPFVLRSRKSLEADGLDPDGLHVTEDGLPVFARLKQHALPSVWQLVDRDVDEHTPEAWKAMDYETWRVAMDQLLPGFSTTAMLRSYSSSSRVLNDGQPVGEGNGHTWVRIADVGDIDRARVAMLARAAEHGKLWFKPRKSRVDGSIVGQGPTTICDPSVWTVGRLVFDGQPVVVAPLVLTDQVFVRYAGAEVLDTAKAVTNPVETLRASLAKGRPMILSGEGNSLGLRSNTLELNTVLELADGSTVTVAQAIARGEKLRCQAPFRESSSMAAFFAVAVSGRPYVHDSGTGVSYYLQSSSITGDAKTVVAKMVVRVASVLGNDAALAPYCINEDVVADAVERSFWHPDKSKVMFLNNHDGMTQFTAVDAVKFGVKELFGNLINRSLLMSADRGECEDKAQLMTDQARLLVQHLQAHRQASKVKMSIDMFIRKPSMTFVDGDVTIVLRHRPFPEFRDIPDDLVRRVWDDYQNHFPEFPAFVEFTLQSRFCAGTRRRAFVWVHANSDWGKGALAQTFKNIGLLYEMDIPEATKAMEGSPSGVDPDDMLRTWILFVDEWKSAPSNLKRLNDAINIAPKNKMRVTVPLYAKVFASAEDVSSLTGGGIEQQFKQRFSYLRPPNADFDAIPLRNEIGSTEYVRILSAGVARYLNARVAQMVAIGKSAADVQAMAWLEAFHEQHLLTHTFESLDDNLQAVADQLKVKVREWWVDHQRLSMNRSNRIPRRLVEALQGCKTGLYRGQQVVQLNDAVFDAWRDITTNKSTGAKVAYKTAQIKEMIDEGETGQRMRYRIAQDYETKARDIPLTSGPVVVLSGVKKEEDMLPEWLQKMYDGSGL